MDVETSQTGYNEMAGKALDAERVEFPLLVRTWRPGDRYRPHDARRVVKLKEMFQRRRIPRHERRQCPVVLSGGEIVWTAPFGPAEESSLRPGSRKAIWIKETPVT
jgi:tRNA(Ile)-lysidine synthase